MSDERERGRDPEVGEGVCLGVSYGKIRFELREFPSRRDTHLTPGSTTDAAKITCAGRGLDESASFPFPSRRCVFESLARNESRCAPIIMGGQVGVNFDARYGRSLNFDRWRKVSRAMRRRRLSGRDSPRDTDRLSISL